MSHTEPCSQLWINFVILR